MGVFNSFVDEHRQRMRQFFARVVDVPALSLREMEIDKYLSALRSGVEDRPRPLHISLNELYFLHRLLAANPDVVKHADAQAALKALPPPPEGRLPKEEDEEVGLRLGGDVALKLQEEVKDWGAASPSTRAAEVVVAAAAATAAARAQSCGRRGRARRRGACGRRGCAAPPRLRAALQLLPPAKISGVHWDDVAVGLRALGGGREPAARRQLSTTSRAASVSAGSTATSRTATACGRWWRRRATSCRRRSLWRRRFRSTRRRWRASTPRSPPCARTRRSSRRRSRPSRCRAVVRVARRPPPAVAARRRRRRRSRSRAGRSRSAASSSPTPTRWRRR